MKKANFNSVVVNVNTVVGFYQRKYSRFELLLTPDQDCKKQCEGAALNQKVVEMPDGSWEASTDSTDFCVKIEMNHFDCRDPAVKTKDFCVEQCKVRIIN